MMLNSSKMIFFMWVFMASISWAEHPENQSKHGTHGMLLFGGANQLYISHLPLFHNPHDQQVIAAVKFIGTDEEAVEQWMNATDLISLVPEPFDLNQITEPGFKVKVNLYRGHFERGGTLHAKGLIMQVQSIIINQSLQGLSPKSQLSYQLISSNKHDKTHYYVRLIDSKPAADHILSVSSTKPLPRLLTIHSGEVFVARTQLADELELPHSAINELYLEINELRE